MAMIHARAPRGIAGAAYDSDVARVLRNTYTLLGISMVPAVAGAALGVVANPLALMHPFLFFGVFMAVMFGFQYVIVRNRDSWVGIAWLQAFTLAMGYFFGPTIAIALSFSNGVDLVFLAFGGTAAIFFAMAALATAVKKNLGSTPLGMILSVGIGMAFLLGVGNFFLQIPVLGLAVSSVFLVVCSGFIFYTLNQIIHRGERNYIVATMTLFVMLLNVFVSLLHLLMAFMGNRE